MKKRTMTLCWLIAISTQFPLPLMSLSTDLQQRAMTLRSKKMLRDYLQSPSKAEKKDVAEIVKALAYDSLTTLASKRSSLKEAGKRIESIHPFRFLEIIFRNEELKAGIRAIRDRGKWIWNDFIGGLTGSLNEEATHQNLLPFFSEFAKNIHFSEERMMPFLQQKKWNEFVNLLIDEIPREINPDRYGM